MDVADLLGLAGEFPGPPAVVDNWRPYVEEMKDIMRGLYAGSMKGRTMYVIPFVMGHLNAENPMFGVEITDSEYVVVSMRVMSRTGVNVLRRMEELEDAEAALGK